MPRILHFTVPDEYDGKKLCAFVRSFVGMSYSLYATLRHTERSVLRGGEVIRSIDRVFTGDIIEFCLPDFECDIIPTEMKLDIIYEDEDIIVLNKSGYAAVHPSHGHREDTLANGVVDYLKKNGKNPGFRAIGRLDKGTSGIVICALNTFAAAKMADSVNKTYIAICDGVVPHDGTVDMPIFRPDPDKTLRACGEVGERAVTHYEVLCEGNGKSLLRLKLETGRTHQIRVHMAYIGAPLVGDSLYGADSGNIGRHLLHCIRSEIVHPTTGERMTFEAPFPVEFSEEIQKNFKRYELF